VRRYDVIVVGAGPAGSTAARRCALGGLKTLLVEKEKLPRYKPCAGGVSRAAVEALDFPLPEQLVERRCRGMRVSLGNLRNQLKCSDTVAYMVSRSAFDAFLSGKAVEAGAALHEKRACVSVEKGERGVVVRTDKGSVRANVVIGADGFHGRVMRSLRPGFDREETRFCVIAEIPLSESRISEMFEDLVEIRYGYVEKGYAWLFPKKYSVSAGIGGLPGEARSMMRSFKRFLAAEGLDGSGRVRGCFIPVTRFTHDNHADGVLLCGDAAGFVDSFSGEGIRFAVMSGALAARTALDCHERGSFSARDLSGYEELCMEAFGRDLLSSAKLTDLLFRHKGILLGTAIKSDRVLRAYLETLTGERSFTEYVGWVKARFPLFVLGRLFSGITRSRS
jgi:geranylgeranyl reductase family protein